MTGLSHSSFVPAQAVIFCKSKDGHILKVGDIVYILKETIDNKYALEMFSVEHLLADSRIKIKQLQVFGPEVEVVVPSTKVYLNIIDHLVNKVAEVKYQLELALPSQIASLTKLIHGLNPDINTEMAVGDSFSNEEI